MKYITLLKKKIIDKNFFQPSWYSVFINPYFIARKSLNNHVKEFSKTVGLNKDILDVGCGSKPYKIFFEKNNYVGIDIKEDSDADDVKIPEKFYDGLNIPYNDNSFDFIICTQVLEHAIDPDKLLKECNRVLKQNGIIFLTMPFVYPEHAIPYDFRRFTSYGHRKIFKECSFDIKSISPTCGLFRVCGQLMSVAIFESIKFKSTLIKLFLSILVCAPIQIISIFLDYIFFNKWITLDYVVIAQKKID
ncbi:MAG: class I SAM-dependent methyltransferase [Candidatus Paceibacterota bacterium]